MCKAESENGRSRARLLVLGLLVVAWSCGSPSANRTPNVDVDVADVVTDRPLELMDEEILDVEAEDAAELRADASAELEDDDATEEVDDTADLVDDSVPELSCNGSPTLCQRPFDEVAVACTHNGFATEEDGFWPPNQLYSMTHQLEDGVRCLMLDFHYNDEGVPSLCHGDCYWGQRPLTDGLEEIRKYLDEDPGAVVTLILENYIALEDIDAAMATAGLRELAYAHPIGTPWPTLQELIDSGKRVVVLGPNGGEAYPWLLDNWAEAFETDWSNQVPEDFTCDVNRGSWDNPLFILNHFVENPLPEPSQAATVNFNPFFLDRAQECFAEREHIPNFVTVDFYDVGDVFDVVDALNTGLELP